MEKTQSVTTPLAASSAAARTVIDRLRAIRPFLPSLELNVLVRVVQNTLCLIQSVLRARATVLNSEHALLLNAPTLDWSTRLISGTEVNF